MVFARVLLLLLSFSSLGDSPVFSQQGRNAVSLGIWFGHYEAGGSSRGAGQCERNPGNNPLWTRFNDWTPWFRVNTDDDWGGCIFQFGILDPYDAYPGLSMSVDFQYWRGGDKPGQNPSPSDLMQCPNPGVRDVPRTQQSGDLSSWIFLDMDNRLGGCQLTFMLERAPFLKLQIEMYPDDEDVWQCPSNPVQNTPRLFQASAGNPVTIIFDTDNRYGGCKVRFRLGD